MNISDDGKIVMATGSKSYVPTSISNELSSALFSINLWVDDSINWASMHVNTSCSFADRFTLIKQLWLMIKKIFVS